MQERKHKLVVPEKIIQKQILNFLSASGIFVFRINTTGVFDPKRHVFRTIGGFSMKGVADILGVLPGGKFLAIEVKTSVGRQSIEQKHFEAIVKKFGGIYVLARSIDDVRFLVRPKNENQYRDGSGEDCNSRVAGQISG